MPVVVTDPGPLNYLVQIEAIDVLPSLFDNIIVPTAVRDELMHPRAPAAVRSWAANLPRWIDIKPVPGLTTEVTRLRSLDDGERAAIAVAREIGADFDLDGRP